MQQPVPITLFTGFLGSGKTTIILNIAKQLPEDYQLVILKNEFGDVEVDSALAQDSHIEITEMTNGCLCCVLVGKMQAAIEELLTKFTPDRIIIETSGSAYPAPIALQIRQMDQSQVKLDSVITVIDAINFDGYKDKSFTAKSQAEFTDILLINKHEEISEVQLEHTLDDVYELNPTTPKIKTDNGSVPYDLLFGLDTKLFLDESESSVSDSLNKQNKDHHELEVELLELKDSKAFDVENFKTIIEKLDATKFYRIKGVVQTNNGWHILNYVAGRYTFEPTLISRAQTEIVFMGYNIHKMKPHLVKYFEVPEEKIFNPIHSH